MSVTDSRSVPSDSLLPMHCSPPGFSVTEILQARTLEWVVIPFSRDLPNWEMKAIILQQQQQQQNTLLRYGLLKFT